jgi:cell division protein FtsB
MMNKLNISSQSHLKAYCDGVKNSTPSGRKIYTFIVSILLLLGVVAGVHAQVDSTELIEMKNEIVLQRQQIDSLQAASGRQLTNIEYLNKTDSAGLWSNPLVQKQINTRIEEANDVFIEEIMLWTIGFVVVVVAVIILLLVLRRQLRRRVYKLEDRITQLQTMMDEDSAEEKARIARIKGLETHPMFNENPADIEGQLETLVSRGDHGLPLRVAGEIHRMRKRLEYMPEDFAGTKALIHSLKRLEDELNTNGYEVVDLIGKKYVDGLNVEARFVPAEDGDIDGETITDILRPQVNFQGIMIQQAKVEVSKSY